MSSNAVKETVEALFPCLFLFEWDPLGIDNGDINPIGFDENNTTHVLYDIYLEKRVEFQWRISLYPVGEITGQEVGRTEREQLIAKALSGNYQVRTMVSITRKA